MVDFQPASDTSGPPGQVLDDWLLPKLDVEGSNPFARFHNMFIGNYLRNPLDSTIVVVASNPVRKQSPESWQSILSLKVRLFASAYTCIPTLPNADEQRLGDAVVHLDDGYAESMAKKVLHRPKHRLFKISMFKESHVEEHPLPASAGHLAIPRTGQTRTAKRD